MIGAQSVAPVPCPCSTKPTGSPSPIITSMNASRRASASSTRVPRRSSVLEGVRTAAASDGVRGRPREGPCRELGLVGVNRFEADPLDVFDQPFWCTAG